MARTANAKRRKKIPLFLPKKQKYACSLYYRVYKVRFSKKRENNVNLNYYQNGTRH